MANSENPFETFIRGITAIDNIGNHQFSALQSPAAVVPKNVDGLVITYVIQPGKAYLFLYMNSDEQRVYLPEGNTFKITIKRDGLEGFVRECEVELIHRGLRPAQGGKQIDGNSRLISKSFTFYDLPPGFEQEAFALMSYTFR